MGKGLRQWELRRRRKRREERLRERRRLAAEQRGAPTPAPARKTRRTKAPPAGS